MAAGFSKVSAADADTAPAKTETDKSRLTTEEDLITFTKGRMTYHVTEITGEIEDFKIGKVIIVGNNLKSTVTCCSIDSHVIYKNNEYAVEAIGDGAFAFSKLEEIIIPYTVKSIGQSAFYGSESLRSVTLGAAVKSIGPGAFSYCNSLEEILVDPTIDPSMFSFRIYNGMIYTKDYKTLVSSGYASGDVTLRKSTESIEAFAFEGNSKVTSVKMNKGLKTVGDRAFYDCSGLEEVEISYSVSSITGNPFEYCPNLKNITVSAKNKKYSAKDSFMMTKSGKTLISCPSVSTGKAELPETVRYISARAFAGNTSLTEIEIGSKIKSIGAGAFADCTGLNSIKFVKCREGLLETPSEAGDRVFGNTVHYLNVYLPYNYPSDEFMAVLKDNCPSGTIYIKSK